MKPPTFSAEASRSRGLICCGGSQWEFAGETGGDVATNETTSRSGVIGITCECDSQCHKQQYTGGQKENFFAKCHLSLFLARLLTFRPCEAALTAQHWAACYKVNTFYR